MNTGIQETKEITGLSIIGGGRGSRSNTEFRAFDPRTGESTEPVFSSATPSEVLQAAELAALAAPQYVKTNPTERAAFIGLVADNLESLRPELVKRASLETGLPTARFEGELSRTTGQLRMFADVVKDGSWVDARIDHAREDRKPLPRPDIRSMLTPLGPVAVFCASNFPLAFSVAGGDTASALASGCPVIVIGHTAHPGTAELAGLAIQKAVAASNLEEGVFSLIFAKDYEAGQALVRHPAIKAVGFTGSQKGGRSLMDIAAARPEPIPVFAEMSAVNPLFILNGALKERTEEIAKGLYASFTMGYGQFCTKPGIVVMEKGDSARELIEIVTTLVGGSEESPLLTKGIRDTYREKLSNRKLAGSGTRGDAGFNVQSAITVIEAKQFLSDKKYSEEIFGPATLFVLTDSDIEVEDIANSFDGQLTATIHGTDEEIAEKSDLVKTLAEFAGRVVFNSFPTGVEVSGAIVHGGPYPATSNAATSSVGKRAITRFTRLVAYQDAPESILPVELKEANPLGINRLEE